MEKEQIKKIDALYLFTYIFIPVAVCAICYIISALFFPKGNMAVILLMGPTIISIVWWIFGGKILFKQKQKKMEAELEQNGFNRSQTFYADGSTVVVDTENGKIAILFFWNPFKKYILPANCITKTWVDDGKGGSGFMEGSSRVSFLFNIDDVKIRVNTFTSNQRWRMDSDYILTGISKADMMVEVIEKARSNSK
ncbi:MAG: hypothetical protein HFJ18_03265 [Clostridia bacterium]|nr:hypothetical protein [Clostridia bacterium]